MNVQLISLAALLAVLAGCPDTPPEASLDVAQAREKIAIKNLTDAESAAVTKTSHATPAGDQAKAATVRKAALESAKRFDH